MLQSNKYLGGIMQKQIEKPSKPCWICGGNDWWLREIGFPEYLCCTCHPCPLGDNEKK